uniref:Protein tyrosine phosphatase non-receptor type 20 n=1 Tax=Sciurus vulgaris TaxID=55149 RepID=A0A8D2ARV2_SCIVU
TNGKDNEGKESDSEHLNFRKSLPSSSKKKTTISKVLQNKVNLEKVKLSSQKFLHSANEYLFQKPSESESDHNVWNASAALKRDSWNSDDEESAGTSKTDSPEPPDTQDIVSEGELTELAQIRPLIFNFNERSAIETCLKVLEKKVAENGTTQEFMTGTSHSVKHLQFTKWPDHGTPASADYFIKFVRYVRKSHRTGPIVVHCSAGVGRTGVFICVDVVFCAIEKNFSFSFENIVTQMREQRHGMIQTKEQYQFCHVIVLEVLQKLLSLN